MHDYTLYQNANNLYVCFSKAVGSSHFFVFAPPWHSSLPHRLQLMQQLLHLCHCCLALFPTLPCIAAHSHCKLHSLLQFRSLTVGLSFMRRQQLPSRIYEAHDGPFSLIHVHRPLPQNHGCCVFGCRLNALFSISDIGRLVSHLLPSNLQTPAHKSHDKD